MDAKPILNDPESSSQDEIKTSHLQEDGLRILARLIARTILNRYLKIPPKHNDEQPSFKKPNLDV